MRLKHAFLAYHQPCTKVCFKSFSWYVIAVNVSTFFCMVGFSLKGSGLATKASNVKVLLNGGQSVTFLRPDGYFSLYPSSMSMYFSALLRRSLLLFSLFQWYLTDAVSKRKGLPYAVIFTFVCPLYVLSLEVSWHIWNNGIKLFLFMTINQNPFVHQINC